MPSFTWVSTANVVEYMGATPVFCDVDLDTFNIDPALIEPLINERTVGIIPVHLFGRSRRPARRAASIARRHGLWVIEDAACAFGDPPGRPPRRHQRAVRRVLVSSAQVDHHRRGRHDHDASDAEAAALARTLRDHGASRSDFERHGAAQVVPAGRLRPPRLQLPHDRPAGRRRLRADGPRGVHPLRARAAAPPGYDERLAGLDWLRTPAVPEGETHGWQAYVCLFAPEEPTLRNVAALHERRNALMGALEDEGIATRPGTHAPVETGLYSKRYGLREGQFPRGAHGRAAEHRPAAVPGHGRLRPRPRGRRPAAPRRRVAMCGIAGVLDRSGAPVPLDAAAPDERRDRPPRPRRRGPVRRRPRRPGQPAPGDHRPVAARRTCRWPSEPATLRHHLQRRALQLPRAATPSSSAAATASARGTDTEVVLPRLRASGARQCVERFNGMFALAIWDRRAPRAVPRPRPLRRQAALLRRGRADWCCSARRSSRCSRTTPSRAELSPPHLLEYFTFQNIFTDGTLFEGVKLLPPGHRVTVCAGRPARSRRERYWDFDFARADDGDGATPRSTPRSSTGSSARPSSASSSRDVPVGAHLSGGMDSGSDHRARRPRRCRT